MFKKLLVAVDGSDASYRAAAAAGALAAQLDATLLALHVISDAPLPKELRQMIELEQINESRLEILKNSGTMILDRVAAKARESGAQRIETEMRQGDPADVIVKAADEGQVDLIVMGHRGLGEVKALLLGSVSRKVCNLAAVNCLTVK